MCQNASFDVALVRHTDRVANGTYSSPSRGPIFGIGFLNAVALRWETLSVGSSFLNCLCLRSFRPFSSFNDPLLNLYRIIACKVVLPMCFSGLFSAFKILLLQLIRSSPRVCTRLVCLDYSNCITPNRSCVWGRRQLMPISKGSCSTCVCVCVKPSLYFALNMSSTHVCLQHSLDGVPNAINILRISCLCCLVTSCSEICILIWCQQYFFH